MESIYYRRPIIVNNYTIYALDIKPKGLWAVEFEGFITEEMIAQVRNALDNPDFMEEMTDHNYQLAKQFFSYAILERQLHTLLHSCFGHEG